jgi:hypothetical protein
VESKAKAKPMLVKSSGALSTLIKLGKVQQVEQRSGHFLLGQDKSSLVKLRIVASQVKASNIKSNQV